MGCEAEVKTGPAKTFYDKRCNGRAYDARLRVSLRDTTSRSPHTLHLSPYNIWLRGDCEPWRAVDTWLAMTRYPSTHGGERPTNIGLSRRYAILLVFLMVGKSSTQDL